MQNNSICKNIIKKRTIKGTALLMFCTHFYQERETLSIIKIAKGIYIEAKIFTDDVEEYAET